MPDARWLRNGPSNERNAAPSSTWRGILLRKRNDEPLRDGFWNGWLLPDAGWLVLCDAGCAERSEPWREARRLQSQPKQIEMQERKTASSSQHPLHNGLLAMRLPAGGALQTDLSSLGALAIFAVDRPVPFKHFRLADVFKSAGKAHGTQSGNCYFLQ